MKLQKEQVSRKYRKIHILMHKQNLLPTIAFAIQINSSPTLINHYKHIHPSISIHQLALIIHNSNVQELLIIIKQTTRLRMLKPTKGQTLTKIKIIDIVKQEHQIQVPNQMTGFQLKQYVYTHLTKQLKTKQMKLTYQGEQFNNNTRICEFNVVIGNMLVFAQAKIDLSKVSKILVHNIQDPIFCEEYTYQWPCGHYIGQAGITAHIKAIISSNQSVILCPFELDNGNKCAFQWDYSICKKIGVFTAQEKKYFQNALSQNFTNQNMKNCPKCNQIFLNESNSNRVRCPHPHCKYGDFCFRCLGPWTDQNSTFFCGSQTCKFANDYLVSAPWDRVFSVTDLKTNKSISVKTPKFRACPNCNMVIQNYMSCKHTDCTKCKIKFCWICLGVYKNKWECGSYKEYCGKVAQVQKYQIAKK